jgi:hypothetical protein
MGLQLTALVENNAPSRGLDQNYPWFASNWAIMIHVGQDDTPVRPASDVQKSSPPPAKASSTKGRSANRTARNTLKSVLHAWRTLQSFSAPSSTLMRPPPREEN